MVIVYSMLEDSPPSSEKMKGNEWVKRITNVNARLQRKIVHLDKKKQIKKHNFRGLNCAISRKKQRVVTLSELWSRNREFCTVYLCPSSTLSFKAFHLPFLRE